MICDNGCEVIESSFSTLCLSERNHSYVLDRYTKLLLTSDVASLKWPHTLKTNENKNVSALKNVAEYTQKKKA